MPDLAHRPSRFPFPDMLPDVPDWFENLSPRLAWHPFTEATSMRIEEYTEEGRLVVRAEIPGIDPDQDLELTVEDGVLTMKAERTESTRDKHHSEIRYGSMSRSVQLPKSAKEDDIRADYDAGMLTVSIGLGADQPEPRRIPITHPE